MQSLLRNKHICTFFSFETFFGFFVFRCITSELETFLIKLNNQRSKISPPSSFTIHYYIMHSFLGNFTYILYARIKWLTVIIRISINIYVLQMLMSTRQKLLLLKRLYLISSQTVGTENVYMNFMLLLFMNNKV